MWFVEHPSRVGPYTFLFKFIYYFNNIWKSENAPFNKIKIFYLGSICDYFLIIKFHMSDGFVYWNVGNLLVEQK